MIGAPIWHFWIGMALLGVGLLAFLGLVAYFLLSVQSQKYPGGKQRRHQDL